MVSYLKTHIQTCNQETDILCFQMRKEKSIAVDTCEMIHSMSPTRDVKPWKNRKKKRGREKGGYKRRAWLILCRRGGMVMEMEMEMAM